MDLRELYDVEQARGYLTGSIIRVSGEPVSIHDVSRGQKDGEYLLKYFRIGSSELEYAFTSAPEVDSAPVPLGLLPVDRASRFRNSVMLYRFPARKYKIGLDPCNFGHRSIDDPDNNNRLYPNKELLYSKQVADAIKGVYPTLSDAQEISYDTGYMVAFSRRFAVRGANLYHGLHNIAVGTVAEGKANLLPRYEYLKESLAENLEDKNG